MWTNRASMCCSLKECKMLSLLTQRLSLLCSCGCERHILLNVCLRKNVDLIFSICFLPPTCVGDKPKKPGEEDSMFVVSDADDFSDEETRRSTSCCHLHVGGHLVESESCKQQEVGRSRVPRFKTWQLRRDLPLVGCGCPGLRSALRRAAKAESLLGLIDSTWCVQTRGQWTSEACCTLLLSTRGSRRREWCFKCLDKQRRAALNDALDAVRWARQNVGSCTGGSGLACR